MSANPKTQPTALDEAAIRDALVGAGLSNRTVQVYVQTLRRAERWAEVHGHVLAQLSALEVRQLCDAVPRTYASRRQLRAALKHYWATLGRENPPLGAVRIPRRPQLRCRALEPDEAAALDRVARARHDHKGLAVLLALYLGLRREEIAHLRWSDFDRDLAAVTIWGKGETRCTLPVHPVLRDELRRFLPALGEWVFPGRFERGANAATIWDWVRQVAAQAGLGEIPPHRLRHTCLATANDVTGDLRAVQDFARHSRPETTAGYTRATWKRLCAVMAALDYQAAEQAAG